MKKNQAVKKSVIILLVIVVSMISVACADKEETKGSDIPEGTRQSETTGTNAGEEQKNDSDEEESGTIKMTLKINDEEVKVAWEDNESVRALADIAAKGPITVNTSLYGGFEQVGGLGTALPSNDVDTTTEPGDIVLYSGSSIVVFFGINTWEYTRLGHIEDRSKDELRDMLGSNNSVLTITSTEL